MNISVLVLDGIFDTGLATILDTLDTANDLAAADGLPEVRFSVSVVGLRRRVRTHHGLEVPLMAVAAAPRPDVLILPALGAKTPQLVCDTLNRSDVTEAGALLRESAERGILVAAACTGTFVLATTAMLDGRTATTSWWLVPLFRERFPRVRLDVSRMVLESHRVVTAGAALAHLDLALWLVRRKSVSLARSTARHLVFDGRPSQAPYMMPEHLAHADPLVDRFERWARQHLSDFSMCVAARKVGASQRTLERRLHEILGKSPLAYVQDLRVEQAVHLLQTTDASVDEIAAQVGYRNGVTLRTLLRRKTGHAIREFRTPTGGRSPAA